MIRDDQRLEVERLLGDGELTCGQIASRVGVSRTTHLVHRQRPPQPAAPRRRR